MKKIIILTLAIIISGLAFSQKQDFKKRKEMVKTERIAFLTNKLNLTPNEAQKFWPVYNEYINKQEDIIMQNHKNMRDFMKDQDNLTDEQAQKTVDTYVSLTKQENELFIEYNKKIEKILPIKKVALLYQAEKQFKRYLMKKMRAKKQHPLHK